MSSLKKFMNAAAGTAAASGGLDVEDVFSTYLYTGNGSTQTITNGIDLAGEGGMVWTKKRDGVDPHYLYDTERGANKDLSTNDSGAEETFNAALTFNANGFTVGHPRTNSSPDNFVSWTFRKAPKFFDVVTYTNAGTGNTKTVSHNLGAVPAVIIIKDINDGNESWIVYHTTLGTGKFLNLNNTSGEVNVSMVQSVSDTNFVLQSDRSGTNHGGSANSHNYVAYLFAHNDGDGEFGPTGDQDIIKCGSFTGTATGYADVSLGWEPQFVIIKRSSSTDNWRMYDNMRGVATGGNDAYLYADTSGAESGSDRIEFTADGFRFDDDSTYENIYIAIRRGPMRTPTSGSEVFATNLYSGSTANKIISDAGFVVDTVLIENRNQIADNYIYDRLRGASRMHPNLSTAEYGNASYDIGSWASMNGWQFGSLTNNDIDDNMVYHAFKRAPGFFDVVGYRSPGSSPDPQSYAHNLGVAPELIIIKSRDNNNNWVVYVSNLGTSNMNLDGDYAAGIMNSRIVGASSTTFTVGTQGQAGGNANGTYIAYLFASLNGVSKVGSYTGNGTSQNINCGFSTGARFVLIKRTDATGDWHLWDTARGIVTGNDPFLELNTTNAEDSSYDSVDPYSAGFSVNQDSGTNINVSSGTYIFLAIA